MKPKLIIYDFDGVMTDNKVILNADGEESVVCNRFDGHGVCLIKKLNIRQLILSGETNMVGMTRAKKLDIEYIGACHNKKPKLLSFCKSENINLLNVIYIGNGLNDLDAMKIVGYPMCPADAYHEVMKICCEVFKAKGGDGVVLELYELLLNWEGI